MKYATFDSNGVLSGRYDSDVNSSIPDDVIELTEDQFMATISEQDGQWKLVDGVLTKVAFQAVSQSAIDAAWNAAIDAQLMAADLKIIRALTEGDTARVNAHKAAQAALRATRR